MKTSTNEDTESIKELTKLKSELLKKYKNYKEDLLWVEDDFEEYTIKKKTDKLAIQIKDLGSKIREIESLEA